MSVITFRGSRPLPRRSMMRHLTPSRVRHASFTPKQMGRSMSTQSFRCLRILHRLRVIRSPGCSGAIIQQMERRGSSTLAAWDQVGLLLETLTRFSQGSEGRVHFCDFVSRIKHLRHMRRVCPSEAHNRLSSFDCRSNGCSTLISDSNAEYRHAIPVEV